MTSRLNAFYARQARNDYEDISFLTYQDVPGTGFRDQDSAQRNGIASFSLRRSWRGVTRRMPSDVLNVFWGRLRVGGRGQTFGKKHYKLRN